LQAISGSELRGPEEKQYHRDSSANKAGQETSSLWRLTHVWLWSGHDQITLLPAYGRYVPSLGQLDPHRVGSAGTAVILVKPFPKAARFGSYDRILSGAVAGFSPKNLGPDNGLLQLVVTTLQMTLDQKS
jgi:hypothetical protein